MSESMSKTKSETVVRPRIEPKLNIPEPHNYRVIYINDETTAMEFVIESLIDVFNYSAETAFQITEDIHHAGSAVVAVLPYEIAEQKGGEVISSARIQNFPLQIKVEPDNVQ